MSNGQYTRAELDANCFSEQAGGPLPRFDGIVGPSTPQANVPLGSLQPQTSGGPIRVPPLAPDKAAQYASLFDDSGAVKGSLPGKDVE